MEPEGPGALGRVRPVAAGDRAEWLRMRAALWPDGGAREHAAEIEDALAGAERGSPALAAVFVWEERPGRLAGFLELSLRDYAEGCAGRTPYVEGWWVDPERRGRGLGAALVAAAEGWARERGHREIASDTELANVASQRAHRALGFQEVERAVHFRKPL